MTTRALALAALLFATGCPIAPSEVEATITLGASEVKYRATLRDLRVITGSQPSALQVVSELAEPPEAMFKEMGWLGRPTTYRWRPTDGGVDLDLEGTFSRAEWERCAVAGCDGGSRCDSFPFERCHGAYQLAGSQLERLGSTPEKWPLDAGVFTFRAKNTEEVVRSGVSAGPTWAVIAAQPTEAKQAAKWLQDYNEAHASGALPELKKLLASPASGNPELQRVVADGVRTARQRLLWAVLSDSEAKAQLPDPPGGRPYLFTNPYRAFKPKKLSSLAAYKLRVAYDVAQHGWVKGALLAENVELIDVACKDKSVGEKTCALLQAKR